MNPVLDASVFVAAISPAERHHAEARALFEGHPEAAPFLVPALFRVEVVAALARRGESDEALELVDALVQGPRFHAVDVDAALLGEAARVARRARLRAYDAVYAALALLKAAPLYTLDTEVRDRLRAAYPHLATR